MIAWLRRFFSTIRGIVCKNRSPFRFGAFPYLPQPAKAIPQSRYASVIIPALNEAKRIGSIVAYAFNDPATVEVIVIDDGSTDDTALLAKAAGAQVYTSTMLGKGISMQDGLKHTTCDLVVYLDGDLFNLRDNIITDLCKPLLSNEADFVKARFGRSGGRVTELTARPMLRVFFPELRDFAQPLGGIIAARKSLLNALNFEDGYGVDVGLLLDAHVAGARLAEQDIGSLQHDSQPLHDLVVMANEVSRVIFNRARGMGRLNIEHILGVYESQRQATATIDYISTRRKCCKRLLLLDMDGTLVSGRFVEELAACTGNEARIAALLDNSQDDTATRSEAIAKVFEFIHKQQFERVANAMTLRPGVIEFVKAMRRAGFMVGVVSDSYFVAAEIVRRRIFADFALAHILGFSNEVCKGTLTLNAAFFPLAPNTKTVPCKSHVIKHFAADPGSAPIEAVWAVGDNLNDLPLLLAADRAFAIEPKAETLRQNPHIQVIDGFDELLTLVPVPEPVSA